MDADPFLSLDSREDPDLDEESRLSSWPLSIGRAQRDVNLFVLFCSCTRPQMEFACPPSASGFKTSKLPNDLQCELDLPRIGGCRSQQTRGPGRGPGRIEDVRIVGSYRRGEVRVIQDVEELCPELHVEALRNSLDIVFFEQRKVPVRDPRPDQNVASRVAAKV